MNTMKTVNTCDLEGAALDWAVAEVEGISRVTEAGLYTEYVNPRVTEVKPVLLPFPQCYSPSTRWAQGGPIIEREKLCIGFQHQLDNMYIPTIDPDVICWARTTAGGYLKYGPTPLIAAMRCYVASRFGDTIDIPDCLVNL